MRIPIDIETLPTQDEAVIADLRADLDAEKAELKAPANYKDADKIAAYIAEKAVELDNAFDERYRKTALDGALGQIAVISFARDDDEPVTFYRDDWQHPDAERDVLRQTFDLIHKWDRSMSGSTRPQFIGHNVIAFDLRFILQRAVILGVRPPLCIPFAAKPWDTDRVYDTMTAWAGVGSRVSLDKLCRVLGVARKGAELGGEDIDGSKVWDFVKAGRIKDVATYCGGDVARVRSVHRRLTFADLPIANWREAA